jgi:xanthine dehydrogenase iron-sulfur cluster and FAD-binding subunit A
MDSTEMLMLMLSRKVSKKVDEQIRERVANNLCVCCGEKPISRDGNCNSCLNEIRSHLYTLSPAKRVTYMNELYASGLRLRPYEIRKYKKPMTILAKKARAS